MKNMTNMSDQEFWELVGIKPPTSKPQPKPQAKLTSQPKPQYQPKQLKTQTKSTSNAWSKAIIIGIGLIIVMLGITIYQSHKIEKALAESASIVALASEEAESIYEDAIYEADSIINEANDEAKKIKETEQT